MSGAATADLPTVPTPSAAELQRLRHKYVRLGELRAGVGVNSASEVREPLRELAREFPGSLRQIDVLSSERIHARAAELQASEEPPEWAQVTHGYHLLMRVTLYLKAELSRGAQAQTLVASVEEQFGVGCTARWIERVRRPPRGRLNDLVFEALAAQFGRSAPELRRMIFPRGDASDGSAGGVH